MSRLLKRKEAAAFLQQHGYPIAATTLQKMASTGGGPPYRRFGIHAIYEPTDLLAWAEAKAGAPRRHTTEAA